MNTYTCRSIDQVEQNKPTYSRYVITKPLPRKKEVYRSGYENSNTN